MKIGILTFHCAINYGAVLQTYALSESLKALGHNVSVIDYRPEYLLEPYRVLRKEVFRAELGNPRKLVREVAATAIRCLRKSKFERFIRRRLRIEALDLHSYGNCFDCIVFGSDQIWNPKITGMDPVYLGESAAFEGKSLIAYAASAGSAANLSVEDLALLQGSLRKFAAVSVREGQLKELLETKLSIPCQHVLDPVLLAGRDVFDRIAKRPRKRPYLLCMSLVDNSKLSTFAQDCARQKGWDYIEVVTMEEYVSKLLNHQAVSIERFVSLFRDADYVITSSYHGTVFSILFEKEFFVCKDSASISERAVSLLSNLGLEERLVSMDSCESEALKPIDWTRVDRILSQWREKSMDFLREALGVKA